MLIFLLSFDKVFGHEGQIFGDWIICTKVVNKKTASNYCMDEHWTKQIGYQVKQI